MNSAIKLAIVGLGRAGGIHAESIDRIPEMELRYVIDPKAEHPLIASLETALADAELDAVIVSSPTQTHYDYIIQSLQAGKHVFTEKPLGNTVDEIAHCFDLAAEKGLVLDLGFQRRFDPNFRQLKQTLKQLGDARILKASSRDNPQPSLEYLRISNNIFHDMLIHDFDMLSFLFGPMQPETVYATGFAHNPAIGQMGDYDTVMVNIKYPNGLMASIDTSRISAPGYDQRIEVFGEKGMAIAENKRNDTVTFYDEAGVHQANFNYSFGQRYDGVYLLELAYFADRITKGAPAEVDKQTCILGHQIADAALESAKTGKAVEFGGLI